MMEHLIDVIYEALEEVLENRVIEVYKNLFAKELFMQFTGYDELKQGYNRVGDLIEEVIKGFTNDIHGFQCTNEQAHGIATRVWEKLKVTYAAEAL